MGKILKALSGSNLSDETRVEIEALDRRLTDLEKFFQEHQSIQERYRALTKPPVKRPSAPPYNPEQGTGTPSPRVITRRPK